jgi:hypothetical protein
MPPIQRPNAYPDSHSYQHSLAGAQVHGKSLRHGYGPYMVEHQLAVNTARHKKKHKTYINKSRKGYVSAQLPNLMSRLA